MFRLGIKFQTTDNSITADNVFPTFQPFFNLSYLKYEHTVTDAKQSQPGPANVIQLESHISRGFNPPVLDLQFQMCHLLARKVTVAAVWNWKCRHVHVCHLEFCFCLILVAAGFFCFSVLKKKYFSILEVRLSMTANHQPLHTSIILDMDNFNISIQAWSSCLSTYIMTFINCPTKGSYLSVQSLKVPPPPFPYPGWHMG